ncbi:MAG: Brp/Blh family beta-carotene 15,15'-dioxygenase, partial [Flavobacteriaceae bacterium]|nr:Brp/Blh family beta-carotene 15,15'-dioxygenase [Flavobacteriaceae bacterium]
MKFTNYLILITFFCFWITGFLYENIHQIIGLFLILTIGIVHGANDILILKKINPKNFNWFYITFKYVFYILFFGLMYYFFPIIFIIVFVLFSSYHFGEQHWLENQKKPLKREKLFAFFYGSFILTILLSINFNEAQDIIQDIIYVKVPLEFFQVTFVFCTISLVFFGALLFKGRLDVAERLWKEILILLVLALIFMSSTIIWSFAVYFILWHSVPSIRSQMIYLYNDTSKNSLYKYFRNSFL